MDWLSCKYMKMLNTRIFKKNEALCDTKSKQIVASSFPKDNTNLQQSISTKTMFVHVVFYNVFRFQKLNVSMVLIVLQVTTEGLPSTKMSLISLQPNQTFHYDLIQRVVVCPLSRFVMANLRAAIFVLPSVVVIVGWIHHDSAAFYQAIRRVADHHLRTGIRIVVRYVNPQCVLSVVGACHSDLDFSVTCWVDPGHAVSKILFKQIFFESKPLLLRCWPRHGEKCVCEGSKECCKCENITFFQFLWKTPFLRNWWFTRTILAIF